MFNNTNKPQSNSIIQKQDIFGTQQPQQQQQQSIFGGNQPQQQQSNFIIYNITANIFSGGNQPQQPNIFGGNQPQQQQQNTNMFTTNQPQQQQTNMFNQQKPTGIFGQQPQQQQQQVGNIFAGNQTQQQQTTNIFGGQQQQQPQQQQGNIFANQQQQPGTIFPNQQQQPLNTAFQTQSASSSSDTQRIKFQIQQFTRRIDPKNLQQIRIDQMNMFKDHRLNDLPQDLKKPMLILANNMKQLKKIVDGIKKENQQLDRKAANYCKSVQQKLLKYKQALIQNIQQTNLIEQVKQQIQMMQNQVNQFIIPLYNAYYTGKNLSFDSPDQFSSKIAKSILEKMIELNNKLDQIVSCQNTSQEDGSIRMGERQAGMVVVVEQLLVYYENVAAKVVEFTNRYNTIKRAKIDSLKRTSTYQEVMRRIQDKVNTKMEKDFKSYDLIKEIESILQKREKKEQQESSEFYRDRWVARN